MRAKAFRALLAIIAGGVLSLPVLSDGVLVYLSTALVFSVLWSIAVADALTMEIPQVLLNILLIACIVNRITAAVIGKDYTKIILGSLLGAVLSFGFFFAVYHLSLKIMSREGIGYGDVKLMAVCGVLLGVGKSVFAIAVSSLSACVVILIGVLVSGKKKEQGYPFAPFLCFGTVFSYLFCDSIFSAYMKLLDNLLV